MSCVYVVVFYYTATAPTEIYTYGHPLSLPYALPICPGMVEHIFALAVALGIGRHHRRRPSVRPVDRDRLRLPARPRRGAGRFFQRGGLGRAHVWTPVPNAHIVCRLLLDKKHLTLEKTRNPHTPYLVISTPLYT